MRNSTVIRRPALLAAIAATGLLAAGILVAAPGGKGGKFFEGLDANGDGAISQQEVAAKKAAHARELDGNNDGFVDYDEMKAAREARAREHFTKRHDANGDGRVSLDEMQSRGGNMFERLDGNNDGTITRDEMAQAREHGRRGQRGPRAGG
jgi:Ca2+-binding EF-hand superfamily protein